MKFSEVIKRALRYIFKGIPNYCVYPKIASLSPNEMLKGRTALITGGTSGIGFEIAKAFLNAKAEVVITGRSEERLKQADAQLYLIYKSFSLNDNGEVTLYQS